MSIICNENVICTSLGSLVTGGITYERYRFTPEEGYALWQDNEEGNIDPETGEPYCYWYQIISIDAENDATHIHAKLIDETMEVFGDTDPNQPEVATFGLRRGVAEEPSHTYIDKNGVERDKRGVY